SMSDFGNIFWIFLMLSMLLPWLQKMMLSAARARLIRRIEKERGSRVIVLIHRQETLSILGFPMFRYIDIDDAERVIRAIHLTDPDIPLDVVLHTPGGLVLASVQIARAIQAHRAKTTIFVPHYAMSGGTLIALAADEIVMDCHAVLGPVDPQLGEYPAASIVRVLHEKEHADIEDNTLILADMSEKALQQIRKEVIDLLEDNMPREKAVQLAEQLSQGTWTHDHPIGVKEARDLGLNVQSDLPKVFYDLMELYPQPLRRQPSVQFIPLPYGPPGAERERK
ncbi:MAG: ATP-dependent Clp protease proteolytic subunit, partial [Planctomycetaceae bacterium]|nr:ATP-dependent Clp protease proteolytic subunit [Planctomycetaceae bacterium]